MRIPGKDLLLFWRARLTKTNCKKTERGNKLESRGHLPPNYGYRRDSPVLVTQMFQSFAVNMRWTESPSVDSEDCEALSLVQTGKTIQILTLRSCTVRSCITQRDAAKSGSNTQNTTIGAMKSDQVQTTGTCFFAFSATPNKFSARLP